MPNFNRCGCKRRAKVSAVPHTFFMVASKRIGVYLQDEPRPKPAEVHGAPTYSFVATPEGLDRTARALQARNAAFEGPADDTSALAVRSLYFNDPAGNHFHLFQPRDTAAAPTARSRSRTASLRNSIRISPIPRATSFN